MLNDFSTLDAQCGASKLAQVTFAEYPDQDPREVVTITPQDDSEEDKRFIVWNVWSNNEILATFTDKLAAAQWANDNGYRIA